MAGCNSNSQVGTTASILGLHTDNSTSSREKEITGHVDLNSVWEFNLSNGNQVTLIADKVTNDCLSTQPNAKVMVAGAPLLSAVVCRDDASRPNKWRGMSLGGNQLVVFYIYAREEFTRIMKEYQDFGGVGPIGNGLDDKTCSANAEAFVMIPNTALGDSRPAAGYCLFPNSNPNGE